MAIEYEIISDFPRLGWIASVDPSGRVRVMCGTNVERHDQWLVEGVWDGDFGKGDFHRHEHFFGTGLRVEGESVFLRTSCTNQTRLLCCQSGDNFLASNSLILLLAATGARLDEAHDYHSEHTSVLWGVKKYDRTFRVIHPRIRCFYQIYYETVEWHGGRVSCSVPRSDYPLSGYGDFINSLQGILQRMAANLHDPRRRYPGRMYSALSSGFDSMAVTCLARPLGLQDVFTVVRSNSIFPSFSQRGCDDGSPVARHLNLRVRPIDLRRTQIDEDETFFMAHGCRKGDSRITNELRLLEMCKCIKEECTDRLGVVFNGCHGDIVWGVDVPAQLLDDQVVRDDFSGISLMEYRFECGFVPAPVPYLLANRIKEIYRITFSEEMRPWRTGQLYDRPIARRIADKAGVPGNLYGLRKKAIVSTYRHPRNRKLRREFYRYLRQRHGVKSHHIFLHNVLNGAIGFILRGLQATGFKIVDSSRVVVFRELHMAFRMWLWAMERLTRRYSRLEALAMLQAQTSAEPSDTAMKGFLRRRTSAEAVD